MRVKLNLPSVIWGKTLFSTTLFCSITAPSDILLSKYSDSNSDSITYIIKFL